MALPAHEPEVLIGAVVHAVAVSEARRTLTADVDGCLGEHAKAWRRGETFERQLPEDVQVLDRVGCGDSFASGVIYGFLVGLEPH